MKVKKMIIALAAVGMAACVQAATVTWQISGQNSYTGWTATLYSGSSGSIATVLATVIPEESIPKGWTDKLSDITGTGTKTGSITGRGSTSGVTVSSVDNSEVWTVVLMNGGFAEGTKYAVMESYNVGDYSYVDGQTPKSMTFKSVTATGTLKVESVPEPTSGLLLLLGVAGLALRRRRA